MASIQGTNTDNTVAKSRKINPATAHRLQRKRCKA